MTERRAISYLRFSTPSQMQGGSLARQIRAGEEYAKKHGLVIDRTVQDLGRSAFKGHHLEGEFGALLAMIREGLIQPGTVLLVENLDRLSRQDIPVALEQFLTIINRGIEVVTLTDQQSYTKASIVENSGQLFISLTVMMRANDESKRKSWNNLNDWAKRRRELQDNKKKISRKCPAWCEYREDTAEFRLIPGRADIVRLIFDYAVTRGWGFVMIARKLNEQGLVCWSTETRQFTVAVVQSILTNHAVTGRYQPCRLVNKRRIPHGDAVLDYFPAVVSFSTWERAAAMRELNKGTGGPKRNCCVNMLTGRVFCQHCGGVVLTKNSVKGSNAYVCKSAYQGGSCTNRKFNSIRMIEGAMMQGASVLASAKFLPPSIQPSQEDPLDQIRQEIAELRSKRSRLLVAFSEGDDQVQELISKLASDIQALESRVHEITRMSARAETRMTIGEMDSIVEKLKGDCYSGDVVVKEAARSKVSAVLRQLIRRVEIDQDRVCHVWCEEDLLKFQIVRGEIKNPVFNIRGDAWRVEEDGRLTQQGPWLP